MLATNAAPAPAAALLGAKILLEKDNEVNQVMVREILPGAGAEVWMVPTGSRL